MSSNQTIEQKYVALNKTCVGWKDIMILLDVSEAKAKRTLRELKKKYSDNFFMKSIEVPLSIIESDLICMGLNPGKITKAYKLIIEKDTIRK